MPRRRYKSIDECRPKIKDRCENILSSSNDNDDELKNRKSAEAYVKDLRWFDHYLDDRGIDDVTEFTPYEAEKLGYALVSEFNGTTPQNRWNQIFNLYDRLRRAKVIVENPLEEWDEIKDKEFGITKSTAQETYLREEETYELSREEIRRIEQNVGVPKLRNQCLVRFLFQSGMRRGECSDLTTDDIDREEREIVVRKAVAKNNRRRTICWQSSLDGLMTEWIEIQRPMFTNGDDDNNWLWVNEQGGKLSGESINEVVWKAAYKAKNPETGEPLNRPLYADANAAVDENDEPIPNRHLVSAHNVRVSLGTYLATETEMGIYEISKALGHESVKTTEEKYVKHKDRAGLSQMKDYGPD